MLDFHSARTAANQRWRRFHCDEFSAANAFRNHQPNLSTRQEKFVSSENKNQLLSSVDYSTEELLKLFCQQYWIMYVPGLFAELFVEIIDRVFISQFFCHLLIF